MTDLTPFDVRATDVTHVIIEIFGGDNNLGDYVEEDMAEMLAGMQGPVAVLALADLPDGEAGVFELAPGIGKRQVEAWGEINTGDPDTLARFLARALLTYGPEVRKAIGFWDHGSGVFDEGDPDEVILARRPMRTPRHLRTRSLRARRLFLDRYQRSMNPADRAMLHDDTNAGVLTNLEADAMLKAAFERAGYQGKVDLIFSDTCLNGMVEVLEQLAPYAACIVGSEELEPGDGWEYHEWLGLMAAEPPATAEAWSHQAVEAFGRGYGGRTGEYPCTLAAYHSEGAVTKAFADLISMARAMGPAGFDLLQRARMRTQNFASNYDSYDLRDFAEQLARVAPEPRLQEACADLVAALDAARIHTVALGPTVKRAHGLAFWFPASFGTYDRDIATYRRLAFAQRTAWADYLTEQFGS